MTSESVDSIDGVRWHGKSSLAVTVEMASSGQRHKVMAALFITGGTETDGSNHARLHVIGVCFVGLRVTSKFKPNVFIAIDLFTGDKGSWQHCARDTVGVRKGIQPEDSIANKIFLMAPSTTSPLCFFIEPNVRTMDVPAF